MLFLSTKNTVFVCLFVLKRARWKSLILDMYKLEASALNMNLRQFRYSLLSWVLQTTKAIVFLPIKAWNETIPHLLLPGVGYLPGVLHPLHRTGCFTFPLHNGVTSTQASTLLQLRGSGACPINLQDYQKLLQLKRCCSLLLI